MLQVAASLGYLWGLLPAGSWTVPTARPIGIRDDRPDSLYLALGARFPAVAQIGLAGGGKPGGRY
jgi:hypothetical protein